MIDIPFDLERAKDGDEHGLQVLIDGVKVDCEIIDWDGETVFVMANRNEFPTQYENLSYKFPKKDIEND